MFFTYAVRITHATLRVTNNAFWYSIWKLSFHTFPRRNRYVLKPLEDAVTKSVGVVESAITLIEGLADKLEEFKNDPEAISRLAKTLNESSDALAAAVAANDIKVVGSTGGIEG